MGTGFLIFGTLILAFGIFMCYAKNEELKGAETVSAVITGFLEKKQHSKYIIETVYCPIAEYEKNGKKITAEHHEYFNSLTLRHSQGETVLIYVDPHMPKKFYFIDDRKGVDLKGVAVAVSGAVILIFGLIALVIE